MPTVQERLALEKAEQEAAEIGTDSTEHRVQS